MQAIAAMVASCSSIAFGWGTRRHVAGTARRTYQSMGSASLGSLGPKLEPYIASIATITFINFQFQGFSEIISSGYYFTGAESSITTSFLYVLVLLHLAHVSAGLIVLSVVLINAYRNQYSPEKSLGVELAELFWHFLDFLWLYLFLFVIIYQ